MVIDNDKPGSDSKLLADLDGLAEQVIRLPERTAIERALARGLPFDAQCPALSVITDLYGLDLNVDDIADAELDGSIVKQLKQKNGLHQPFVAALPDGAAPPLAAAVLDTLTQPVGQQVLTELRKPVTYQPTPALQAVIDADDPVLLVLGGAGTGKTSTAAAAIRTCLELRSLETANGLGTQRAARALFLPRHRRT